MTAKVISLVPPDVSTSSTRSDASLVTAMAQGDRDALGLLYDRHQAVVWRFVARSLGPGGADVEDLVQSTFVEAWRSAARFGGRSAVRTWILGIAHNLMRRTFRDRARRRTALEVLADHAPTPDTPEPKLHDRLLLQRVREALVELPPDLRAAFVLCELEEIRGVDAAKILGVRPGTLWRRLHNARRRIRLALEGDSA